MQIAAAPPRRRHAAADWNEPRGDASLAPLVAACRGAGGLVRGDDLAQLLEDRGDGNIVALARQIVAGEVIAFEWHGCVWIPLFQFEAEGLGVRRSLQPVLAELGPHYDGAGLAAWFVEPNGWLDEARPIDLLESRPAEVLQAARADRFVATC